MAEKQEGGLPWVKIVLLSAFVYVFGAPLLVLAKFGATQLMGTRFTDGPTAVPDNMGEPENLSLGAAAWPGSRPVGGAAGRAAPPASVFSSTLPANLCRPPAAATRRQTRGLAAFPITEPL